MFRRFVAVSSACAVLLSAGLSFGGAKEAEDSFQKLMEGNKRFVSGELHHWDVKEKRESLVRGQHPSAIVVACSDSREVPELLFDQDLGDLFVVRAAGNVLDAVELGSIEYAAEHLHAPLVIILGHDSCGAVTAAVDAKGKPEGNIGAIVKRIQPAVKKAKTEGGDRHEIIDHAVRANVTHSEEYMLKNSPVLKHLVEKGELRVVTAVYHLSDGKVEVLCEGDCAGEEMKKRHHEGHSRHEHH
ncbi:MAG: carbonic anhydrase [Nitrospirales bacterium]|nr:carbonic anhydrase [Nitrospirales bacterium]